MKLVTVLAAVSAAVLTACGGGGDSGPTGMVPNRVDSQGIYVGPSSLVLITPNEEFYSISVSPTGVSNVFVGSINDGSGNQITVTGNGLSPQSKSISPETFKLTVTPKVALSSQTATLSYSTVYDTPAKVSDIAGNHQLIFYVKEGSGVYNATISSTGTFDYTETAFNLSCRTSGRFIPTNKGYFNVEMTSTGVCSLGNGVTTYGKAVYDPNTRSLFAVGMNRERTNGFAIISVKAVK